MEDSENDDPVRFDEIDDSVRKTLEQRTSHLLMNDGIALRLALDPSQGGLDCQRELVPEPLTLMYA